MSLMFCKKLVASWNSGSKFVSRVLNSQLRYYYHYEPLHKTLEIAIARQGNQLENMALETLRELSLCRISKPNF